MSVSSQGVTVSFGPQSGKGVEATTYFRHRALACDLNIIDPVQQSAPEIGGMPTPDFVYKSGPMVAGSVSLQPRLESSFGWLLYSLLGKLTTSPTGTTDVDRVVDGGSLTSLGILTIANQPISPSILCVTPIGMTGNAYLQITGTNASDAVISETVALLTDAVVVNTENAFKTVTSVAVTDTASAGTVDVGASTGAPFAHTFELNPADPTNVPWTSWRKAIPRNSGDANSDLGEVYTDCKIVGGTFLLPSDGPMVANLSVLGRTFEFDDDPTAWTYDNSYEDMGSVPIGLETSGYIKIGGTEYPVVGAQFSWVNSPEDLRSARVFGDPYLDDIGIIGRAMGFQITVKYEDPTLYQLVMDSQSTGTWSPQVYTSALDILCVSTEDIDGNPGSRYSLRVQAPVVSLQQVGGISPGGVNAIMLTYAGTVLDGGAYYAKFTLTNGEASYTWPV